MAFLPFVVAVLAGLAIGLLRGGRMSALQRVRIHAPIFVIVAIGSGIALDYYSVPFASLIAVVGIAAGVGLSLRNIHLAGMGVVSNSPTTRPCWPYSATRFRSPVPGRSCPTAI